MLFIVNANIHVIDKYINYVDIGIKHPVLWHNILFSYNILNTYTNDYLVQSKHLKGLYYEF
jgi:hypothetical protein